jgi:hypothetical protein
MGVELEKVPSLASSWKTDGVKVPLQVALDACFVPTAQGLRVDEAHLVVIGARSWLATCYMFN